MRIIIYIGYEKSNTEIPRNHNDEPEERRNTAFAKRSAVHQYENAISSYQAKNGARSSNTNFLRHKVEAGDDANDSCCHINEQETHVPYQPLQKDTQYRQVEYVQTHVQQVCMKKYRSDKTPILSL